MLLPHGYEGQGPEHSSARMERYLGNVQQQQLANCAADHACPNFPLAASSIAPPIPCAVDRLHTQGLAASSRGDKHHGRIGNGSFRRADRRSNVKAAVKRVLMVSGKLYYDLLKRQQEEGRTDIAVVRLEQIYPLPTSAIGGVESEIQKCQAVVGFRTNRKHGSMVIFAAQSALLAVGSDFTARECKPGNGIQKSAPFGAQEHHGARLRAHRRPKGQRES
jgi:2-oxoglutarate dehydrogenase complex dehydrogenase (E1) component-like enzyme